MPKWIQIDNFEISFLDGEAMLSFDLPEDVLKVYPSGLRGNPSCYMDGDVVILSYATVRLHFQGIPSKMICSGKALLCAQMSRGKVLNAEFTKGGL